MADDQQLASLLSTFGTVETSLFEVASTQIQQTAKLEPNVLEDLRNNKRVIDALKLKYPNEMENVNIAIPVQLCMIGASYIGKYISFVAEIVGQQVGMAKLSIVRMKCIYCGYTQKFRINEDEIPAKCPQCKRKSLKVDIKDSQYKNFTKCFVRDVPESLDSANVDEYIAMASKVFAVHYSDLPPAAFRVKICADVIVDAKTDEIEFISDDIRPLDDITAIKFVKGDMQKLRNILDSSEKYEILADTQIAPLIVGRLFEKEAALLTLCSIAEIPDITGTMKIRGALYTIFIGDAGCAKSAIAGYIPLEMRLGEYLDAANSTRTGLTYTIDKDSKVIIWGALPNNDRKFLAIDDFNQLHSDENAQMRETLTTQTVKVDRSVKGQRKARVRLIVALNPGKEDGIKPMSSYLYNTYAIQDTWVFKDPPDIRRYDLIIPFCEDDVSNSDIAKATARQSLLDSRLFSKFVKFIWNLKIGQIVYSDDVKEIIISNTNALLNAYDSPYPIVNKAYREVLTRISVSYACLRLSFDENLTQVIVLPEHVQLARNFIDEMITRLEYDKYVALTKGETKVSPEEMAQIKNALDDVDRAILQELSTRGVKSAKDLAVKVNLSDRAVKDHYPHMQQFELISTSKGYGVKIKPKGVAVVRHLLKSGTTLESSEVVKRSEDKQQPEGSLRLPTLNVYCEACGNAKATRIYKKRHICGSDACKLTIDNEIDSNE